MSQVTQGSKGLQGFRATIGNDALASVVVFLVALPLCMGISIASGVPPTADLTVLVWQLVQHHGLAMLGVIVLLAGLIQLLAGLLKLGQWFRAVSPAVIHGMLAGIGVLIFASQFHVMLDKKPIGSGMENFAGIPTTLMETFSSNSTSVQALYIGLLTIALIVLWNIFAPKKLKVLPGPLIAVVVAVIVAAVMQLKIKYIPDLLANPDDINNIWTVIQYPILDNLKHAMEPAILTAAVSVAFIASAETLLSASAARVRKRQMYA